MNLPRSAVLAIGLVVLLGCGDARRAGWQRGQDRMAAMDNSYVQLKAASVKIGDMKVQIGRLEAAAATAESRDEARIHGELDHAKRVYATMAEDYDRAMAGLNWRFSDASVLPPMADGALPSRAEDVGRVPR